MSVERPPDESASRGDQPSADVQLVRSAQRGDRNAFARLYEAYAPVVHGVLLAHARAGEVGDLLHDVFLAALRGIARVEEPAQFGAWLCQIARNHARDDHKRRRADVALVDEPSSRPPSTDDEDAVRALAALRELPEAYRETLALRLVEGLSGPEIAARTGLTPGSVRVNLCRGMKLLRDRLAQPGRVK